MKLLYWLVGLIIGIPALVLIVIFGASELGGEVVTLERAEPGGESSNVRIWIVDQDDASWIEHGDATAFWMAQLAESGKLVLSRGGQASTYVATPDSASHELYHRLRREKYGWADQVVELFSVSAAECESVPVRLERQ